MRYACVHNEWQGRGGKNYTVIYDIFPPDMPDNRGKIQIKDIARWGIANHPRGWAGESSGWKNVSFIEFKKTYNITSSDIINEVSKYTG